ncbi:MAG: multiple monosaccharide ABC transporter permease [Turicibacter sp.]
MESIKKLFKGNLRQYGMVIALISLVILFQILTDGILLKPLNVTNLILQNSYILILAIGMLLVILTGNVDLSVGSVVAFVGAIGAMLMVEMQVPVVIAVIASLIIGGLAGAFNGFFIAYAKIPAFIVTLASMLVFRGLTLVVLNGRTIAPFPESFQFASSGFIPDFLGQNTFNLTALLVGFIISVVYIISEIRKRKSKVSYQFDVLPMGVLILKFVLITVTINLFAYWFAAYKGIPSVLVLLVALILIYSFITNRTIAGRHIYAYGGNAKAAELSGVKVKRVLFWVYVNMGLLAAIAGLIFAGRLNAATPKAGMNFELDAIAACYIGGASSTGGVGTVIGAIIGGLVMGILNNGMSILGIGIDYQQAIKGFVLLMAVVFDVYTKNKSSKAVA